MGPSMSARLSLFSQQWDRPKVIAESHCETMTWDRISATTAYVMWREEHLWNVTVLQRVNLYKLVFAG
jgi:hypothetical protein